MISRRSQTLIKFMHENALKLGGVGLKKAINTDINILYST